MSLFSSITKVIRSVLHLPTPVKPPVKPPVRTQNHNVLLALGSSAGGSCYQPAKPPKCTGNI